MVLNISTLAFSIAAGFPLFVTGKVLSNEEIEEIENIIKEKIDIQLNFDSPNILGLHCIKKAYNKEIAISETKFHRGALRSRTKN